jgi:hypothetical protein
MKRLLCSLGLLANWAVLSLAQGFVFNDRAAGFFNDSTVKEIRLYFDDPNWNNILVQNHGTPADPYTPCRFKYENIELPRIGCRYKGNASFRRNVNKRPFKLDFNEFDPSANFLGLTKLNIHTNDLQPDFMREKLYTDFMGKYVPAPRMVHVKLFVNDRYHGLYCAMEQPDKNMFEARYGRNEDGNLWEGGGAGGPGGGGGGGQADLGWRGAATVSLYRGAYELETNVAGDDYSQLIEFINVLNNTPPAELPARLEPIADVESLLMWLALNNLFVNLDSYINAPSEYYIYDRTLDGRFVVTQWDHNEAFGTTGDGTQNLANPFVFDPFWLPNATANRPLATRLWAVPDYRRFYLRSFARFLREGFNPEMFSARITQLAGQIREHVIADTNKNTSNAQFELAQNEQTTATQTGGLRVWGANQFVRERHTYLRIYLNSLALPADIRLNEIVAVNNGGFKDEAGDSDPWVELYNPGPGAVTLTNFSLTDDAATPSKWTIPAKTLKDGEYLILWLDNETSEGDMHANFRLNAAGGKLFLFAGGTQTDTVTYPALASGQNYIRLREYGATWASAFQLTPNLANPAAGASVAQPPTQGTGQLLINEIMADNEDTYPDPQEAGAFEDWIEIFNPGTSAVNMSGMYLTDNLNNRIKWKIPEGVTIPARGYLVFIADNETAQGPLHTSWQLSAEGESVGLYGTDGTTLIDSYTFGIQQGDVSIGRVTDGDGAWSIFQPATPGAANTAAYVPWVTNAASYLPTVAPNGISSLFGTGITSGVNAASTNPLPTTLGGATVSITDKNNVTRDAPLFFTSA